MAACAVNPVYSRAALRLVRAMSRSEHYAWSISRGMKQTTWASAAWDKGKAARREPMSRIYAM
jgi:hypothetical protein